MATIQKYFEQAAKKAGSDYALARLLGISHQATSKYRLGQRTPDPDVSWKLAEYIGENPTAIIAAAALERAKTQEERSRWTQRLGKLRAATATGAKVAIAGTAFGAFLGAALSTSPGSFGANASNSTGDTFHRHAATGAELHRTHLVLCQFEGANAQALFARFSRPKPD